MCLIYTHMRTFIARYTMFSVLWCSQGKIACILRCGKVGISITDVIRILHAFSWRLLVRIRWYNPSIWHNSASSTSHKLKLSIRVMSRMGGIVWRWQHTTGHNAGRLIRTASGVVQSRKMNRKLDTMPFIWSNSYVQTKSISWLVGHKQNT